jgi:hypothetical protein
MRSVSAVREETQAPDHLTGIVVGKLKNPATSSDFNRMALVERKLIALEEERTT